MEGREDKEGEGVGKSTTSDLEVVGKTLFCGSGCEKLPQKRKCLLWSAYLASSETRELQNFNNC